MNTLDFEYLPPDDDLEDTEEEEEIMTPDEYLPDIDW